MGIKNKKGISLIVLIITIIVVIILAAAVILTILKNNPVSSAKEAAFKEDIRSFQTELSLYVGKQMTVDYYGNRKKISTSEYPKLDEMKEYISSYSKKYVEKLGIDNDELVYFPDKVTENEKKWLDDLGIRPYSKYVPEAGEDCFIWNGNAITGYYDEKLKEFLSTTNGVLKIPKRCTGISYISFEYVSYIENVITQDGLLNVSPKSFRNCVNLKSVYISKSVRYISDEWVFNGCSNLVSIEVDSENECYSSQDGVLYNKEKTTLIAAPGKIEECNVPSTVKTIGKNAFSLCKNLKKVVLLDGLESIGASAFEHCTSLSEVKLPNTLKKVDIYAFYSANITGELDIPDSVETIENSSFSGCHNISKVVIGSNLKTISGTSSIDYYNSFRTCSNLKEFEVKSGNNYFSSQDGILYNKDKTKLILAPSACEVNDLYIPNSVKEIGDYSFYGSTNVKGKIYLPEGLISIGSQSFSECGISGEVNIPSSVTSIKNSFFNAEYITKINVDSHNVNYSSQDGILYNKDKTELIIAPHKLTINNLTLPDSLKVIDGMAFDSCQNITGTLTLNDNLETIKDRAFYCCSGISGTVVMPESVKKVERGIFESCVGIQNIKCRASSKPDGWDDDWNRYCNANVVWGYTGD